MPMTPPTVRRVSLLLVALALVVCVPEHGIADAPPVASLVSDIEAGITPVCGTATDDEPGLPTARTRGAAAVGTAAKGIAPSDLTPGLGVPPLPVSGSGRISLDVPVPRAPPLG